MDPATKAIEDRQPLAEIFLDLRTPEAKAALEQQGIQALRLTVVDAKGKAQYFHLRIDHPDWMSGPRIVFNAMSRTRDMLTTRPIRGWVEDEERNNFHGLRPKPARPAILHLRTKNDANGNPRRLYALVRPGERPEFIDEGYVGASAITEAHPELLKDGRYAPAPDLDLDIPPAEYRRLKP